MNLKTYILLLALTISHAVSAQTDIFCRIYDFASSNGLLQSHISNAQQDSKGFMWFATWNGLIRYDGYNYYTFKPVLSSEGTISSNRIFNIKLTTNQNIWCVSSDNQLYLFDTQTCLFSNLSTLIPQLRGKKVKTITPLKNKATWVTFKDYSCIRLVDAHPARGYHYYQQGHHSLGRQKTIHTIALDPYGQEWVMTDKAAYNMHTGQHIPGVYKYLAPMGTHFCLASKDGRIALVNRQNSWSILSKEQKGCQVNHIECGQQYAFLACNTGVVRLDRKGKATVLSDRPSGYLYLDSHHRLWIFHGNEKIGLVQPGSSSEQIFITEHHEDAKPLKNPQLIFENNMGQVVVKPEQGTLSYYDEQLGKLLSCPLYDESRPIAFHPESITKYLIDYKRNLWLFQEHKAYCITFRRKSFFEWHNPSGVECRTLGVDFLGRLWAADRTMSFYQMWQQHPRYLTQAGMLSSSQQPFTHQAAYSFMLAKDHRIWIGTKGDGVYLLTPHQNADFQIEHLLNDKKDPLSLGSDTIYSIFQDHRGRIWLGSYGNGLFIGQQNTGRWTFHKVNSVKINARIRCMTEPQKDILLIGTSDGLISLDTRDCRHYRSYTNTFRQESWGLKGNDIMQIVKCGKQLYACVFGSGLSKILSDDLLSDTIHFHNYMLSSSSTSDQIKTAISDDQNIWIISDKNITRFNAIEQHFTSFDAASFMSDINFSEAQPVFMGDSIIVGTSVGIMAFPKDVTLCNASKSTLVVTGIQYNKDMTIRPLNDIDNMVINPQERSFSLYLSSLDYENREPDVYRYRMEGYEEGWNYSSENQHSVNYNNISPGHYQLVIQSRSSDGSWNNDQRVIPVNVTPRFTETIWFRLFCIIMIVSVIIALLYAVLYLNRIRYILQKKCSLLMTVDQLTADMHQQAQAIVQEASEKEFLEENIRFLEENLQNENLLINDFAHHLGMSRTAYYNRMKEITGLSPIEFIRQIRIKKALPLLTKKHMPIAEAAYHVGFTDPKYFSRCFRTEMGISPTEYLKSENINE